MESFVQAGALTDNDEAFLYCLFKRQFLAAVELKEHHALFKRSQPGSKIHTYEWMYTTCANVLEAEKLESNARARVEASRPGAADPATPGVEDDSAKKARLGKRTRIKLVEIW